MSVATMWIREAISATSVSVVATCNKFISELVNWVIWNKHTTSDGLGAVLVIMVCGIFYEQAPLRAEGQRYVREEICPCVPRSWLANKPKEEGDAQNRVRTPRAQVRRREIVRDAWREGCAARPGSSRKEARAAARASGWILAPWQRYRAEGADVSSSRRERADELSRPRGAFRERVDGCHASHPRGSFRCVRLSAVRGTSSSAFLRENQPPQETAPRSSWTCVDPAAPRSSSNPAPHRDLLTFGTSCSRHLLDGGRRRAVVESSWASFDDV